MSKPKYEVFNISTGKFEDTDFSPDDFFDELASKIADESSKLYDMYRAEREIVQSIIENAVHEDQNSNRSMD